MHLVASNTTLTRTSPLQPVLVYLSWSSKMVRPVLLGLLYLVCLSAWTLAYQI
jgi:hypothetical protein